MRGEERWLVHDAPRRAQGADAAVFSCSREDWNVLHALLGTSGPSLQLLKMNSGLVGLDIRQPGPTVHA